MSVLSPRLVALVERRHHTVRRSELLADGVNPLDIDRWLGARVLVERAPNVYVVADALLHTPFMTRAAAVCIGDDDAVLDAVSSARVWGFEGVFRSASPSTISGSSVPRSHVVERRDGLRLLSRGATWLGLAGVLRPDVFSSWSSQTLGSVVSLPAAHAAVRRGARLGRAADDRAATVLSSQRRWQRPDPGLDRRVRTSLRRRGYPGLIGTHQLDLPNGFRIWLTAADLHLRWGVEIDHRSWHRGRWADDRRRWIERQVRHLGWRVVSVDDRQLDRDFTAVMSELAADHDRPAAAA